MCGFAPTFGQTRSGTRDTHASGQDLPLIRAFFDSLVRCPQARLRTFPGNNMTSHTRGEVLLDQDRRPEMRSTGRAVPARCRRDTGASAVRAAWERTCRSHDKIGRVWSCVWGPRAGCRPCLQLGRIKLHRLSFSCLIRTIQLLLFTTFPDRLLSQ